MTDTMSLVSGEDGVLIRIPMRLKKRGGRKEVIVPDGLQERMKKPDYDEPFVIAIARAYCWQDMLDSGRYCSIREMAKALGVCSTYMSRLIRFTILAPDIIESLLDGREPDGFSQVKLAGAIPGGWEKQRGIWGFEECQAVLSRLLSDERT